MRFLAFFSTLGMQLKGVKCMIFQILVFSSIMFLRQGTMIEHNRIFFFVYANSLLGRILERGLTLDQGVLAQ